MLLIFLQAFCVGVRFQDCHISFIADLLHTLVKLTARFFRKFSTEWELPNWSPTTIFTGTRTSNLWLRNHESFLNMMKRSCRKGRITWKFLKFPAFILNSGLRRVILCILSTLIIVAILSLSSYPNTPLQFEGVPCYSNVLFRGVFPFSHTGELTRISHSTSSQHIAPPIPFASEW